MRELDETEITIISGGGAGNNGSAHYSTIAGMGKGAAAGSAGGGAIGAVFGAGRSRYVDLVIGVELL